MRRVQEPALLQQVRAQHAWRVAQRPAAHIQGWPLAGPQRQEPGQSPAKNISTPSHSPVPCSVCGQRQALCPALCPGVH